MKIRRRDKIKNYLSFNKRKLIPGLLVLTILLLSVGYSAFSSHLNISGFLTTVRIQKDIRVTGVSVVPESIGSSNSCTYEDLDSSGTINLSDKVTCGTESFYVMENDGTNITMLAMYNLNVGDNTYTEGTLGIQNEKVKGYLPDIDSYGMVSFSTIEYWTSTVSTYPAYVYGDYTDSSDVQQNMIYPYVEAYETYLKETLKVSSASATLMNYAQITDLRDNKGNPSWLYDTSYWLGVAFDEITIGVIWSGATSFADDSYPYFTTDEFGVRPVVTINKNEFDQMIVQNNGGESTYTEYNVSNITAGIKLPNDNSSVTYKVKVTNIGNAEAGILEITGLPENLDYKLLNYDLKEKLCDSENRCSLGITKDIYITIKYKEGYTAEEDSENYQDIVVNFNFQPYYTVTYTGIEGSGYPTEVMGQDTLIVDFGSNALPYVSVKVDNKKITNFTYSNGILTVPNVNGNVEVLDGLETYTGTYLALNNQNIYNYKIFGNSIQNGTPTPETPVEIESVGEKTKNLSNPENVEIGGIAGGNGTNYTNEKQIRTDYDEISPSTEYYFNIDSSLMGTVVAFYYDEEKNFITFATVNATTGKFTTPENAKYVRFRINNPSDTAYSQEQLEQFKNVLMVCLFSEDHEYEPYGKYKIPIEVIGENLFDNQEIYKRYDNDVISIDGNKITIDTPTQYGTKWFWTYVPIKKNKTYKISYSAISSIGDVGIRYKFITEKETTYDYTKIVGDTISNSEKSFIVSSDIDGYLALVWTLPVEESSLYLENVQVEERYTANIYLDEPLRKIGSDADYIDFNGKKLVRYVGKKELDGVTSGKMLRTYTRGGYISVSDMKVVDAGKGIGFSSFAQATSALTSEGIAFGWGNTTVYFCYINGLTDYTQINALINELYLAGVDTNIYYQLASPQETTIDLPELTTFEGTTYVSAGGATIELKVNDK